ncbi:MAG: hypothetical protein K8W52_47570 [Deltaproteobacteria bacterium]|nr:hypothetical protein [Deltaproteobacteria bacterium]
MRNAPRLALAVLALATTRSARADEIAVATDAPRTARRIEARIGMLAGGGDVADVTGPSAGLHTSLGARLGEITTMAEYDYLSIGDAYNDRANRHGTLSRIGATARYALFRTRDDSPIATETWVEAGVGYERIAWGPGGLLRRPDLALGFGAELDGRPGWRSKHPRHLGMWLGLRAIVARAPAGDMPAVCGGPCTQASPPSRNDVSIYFSWGAHFGR